jgi:hypothetical protein
VAFQYRKKLKNREKIFGPPCKISPREEGEAKTSEKTHIHSMLVLLSADLI